MAGFFDFLGELSGPGIHYGRGGIERMNWRHRHIIDPVAEELAGATVLDLGSHDGRWPYALAAAGATVTGIEGRGELIDQFSRYPDEALKQAVTIHQGDFLLGMDRMAAEGRTFDVVTNLGVFYHTMEHYRILKQMVALRPRLIVIDSVFHLAERPIITLRTEDSTLERASIAQHDGQVEAPVGRISRPALELLVESLGHTVEWVEWQVPPAERESVKDYFKQPKNNLQRFTCLVRPA